MYGVVPSGHFSHFVSLLSTCVLCVGFLALLVWSLRRVLADRAKGRIADVDVDGEFAEGPGFVTGTVELDEAAPFAARVEIQQEGRERNRKGSISHEWHETRRRTFTHPFWIRHATGRVFVPAAKNIRLVDKLDRLVHDEALTRYRIAELSAGETVIAAGVLERKRVRTPARGAYRDGVDLVWTLTPGGDEPLRLSAERFGDRYRRRASSRTRLIFLGWIPCFLVSALCVFPFVLRVISGAPVDAVVTSLNQQTTRDSNQRIHHEFHVHYETDEGFAQATIPSVDWRPLSVGDHLAVYRTPGLDDVLGQDATLYFFWLLIPSVLFAVLFLFMVATKPEWYEVRVINRGGGRLDKPAPATERVLSRGDPLEL